MSERAGEEKLRAANRAVMTEALRRLGSADFEGACALLSEDVLCDWPYLPMKGLSHEIRGRRAMQEFFAGGMSAFDPYLYEITAVYELVDPSRLIAEYRSNSRLRATNTPYRNAYLGIFEFRDGLIAWWREYINPMIVAEVMATLARKS